MDLVIWPSRNVNLSSVTHILAEDPASGLLNDFAVEVKTIGVKAPILANSRSSPQQISKLMRWFTTRYNLNSYYLDLTQVLKPNDWTPNFNLQISGQTKIGRAIARTVSGTPIEVFIYG
jgi:hypothetical protein